MNTVNKVPEKHLLLKKRPENYCETVKIIKEKTKITILFKKHIFQHKNFNLLILGFSIIIIWYFK